MLRFRTLGLALVGLLILPTIASAQSKDPVVIGVGGPLTGP